MAGAAISAIDKHLAQGRAAIANIAQGDTAYHLASGYRDPEIAATVLVETRNIEQIGLLFQRHRDAEFLLLDRQDQGHHALGIVGGEGGNTDRNWIHQGQPESESICRKNRLNITNACRSTWSSKKRHLASRHSSAHHRRAASRTACTGDHPRHR